MVTGASMKMSQLGGRQCGHADWSGSISADHLLTDGQRFLLAVALCRRATCALPSTFASFALLHSGVHRWGRGRRRRGRHARGRATRQRGPSQTGHQLYVQAQHLRRVADQSCSSRLGSVSGTLNTRRHSFPFFFSWGLGRNEFRIVFVK